MLCLPDMSKDAYDSPWKGIIDRYFPAFIAFFFPEIYREIDWAHSYEILDKELEKITRDAEFGKRHADKLITNPFATVVMAHLKTLATREDPDARFRWKMFIFRRLYESGHDRQEILDLLWFVDWVMWLPPKLKQQFEGTIEAYEAEKQMEYMTTWERKGIRKGEATILKRQLTARFDGLPGWVEERLAQASREQLESWADRVLDAKQLEDVFSPA